MRLCLLLFLAIAIGQTSARKRHRNKNLKTCQGSIDDSFFNMYITLGDVSDECQGDDFVDMGMMINSAVKDLQQDIPEYRNEFVDVQVCPAPIGQAVSRRLAEKYTYAAGGTCRMCSDDNGDDRRLLLEEDLSHFADKGLIINHKLDGKAERRRSLRGRQGRRKGHRRGRPDHLKGTRVGVVLIEDWLAELRELIVDFLPESLMEDYGGELGCLQKEPNVTVDIIKVGSRKETLTARDCESNT